mgnify:CR=1 FL=1
MLQLCKLSDKRTFAIDDTIHCRSDYQNFSYHFIFKEEFTPMHIISDISHVQMQYPKKIKSL